MLKFIFIGVALLTVMISSKDSANANRTQSIYVSPQGNDSWTGLTSSVNRQKNDGPFATVAKAQAVARNLKRGAPDDTIQIVLRGGVYYMDEPLVVTPEDSGSSEAPVVYMAYKGEKPVLSGGRPIRVFQDEEGVCQASLNEVKEGKWNFAQIWVNGERRYRPRLPKKGYYFISSDLPPSPAAIGKGYDRFEYRDNDLNPNWRNLGDVEVNTFHSWTTSRLRIQNIDTKKRSVQFTGPTVGEAPHFNLPKGGRYLIDNVREALGDPEEWYLDKVSGEFTYILGKAEKLTSEIIAPRLEKLLVIQGDVEAKNWVHDVHFKGITFSHSNWVCPPEGYASPQSESKLGAAVSAEGARRCVFDGVTVSHVGTYGIELGAGCRENVIENCTVTDTGAGGLKIGLLVRSEGETTASHNIVRNCTLSHGGRLHPAGVGVFIGQSPYNTISHNDIFDYYYTGISCGWTWGYGLSQAHHNTLEYNHIHDIGQYVLSDMGGIYTLGIATGSIERGNVIHDVNSFSYGGWGIYFDEGSTGWLAEKNLVYRCKTGGLHQHYGQDNVVRNNIFAFSPQAGQLVRTRPEPHTSFIIERNIVYYKNAPLLGSDWTTNNNFRIDHNLYWDAGREPVTFAGMSLAEWQKKGNDVHSIVADPLFVNASKYDFRLKPDSPAFKLGFVAWDISSAGRTSGGVKKQSIALPRAFPLPTAQPTSPMNLDFELLDVGDKTTQATTVEENDKATVRVTDETASSGKHSLKFVDMAGQKESWNPHISCNPNFTDGMIEGSFDLRMENGAILLHEWRDAASPFTIGPSILVSGDGNLTANGKQVTKLKHGKWYGISIRCRIGKKAPNYYELSIKTDGETPIQQRIDQPKGLHSLQWYGFIADSNANTVFYVDNIHLNQVADAKAAK